MHQIHTPQEKKEVRFDLKTQFAFLAAEARHAGCVSVKARYGLLIFLVLNCI